MVTHLQGRVCLDQQINFGLMSLIEGQCLFDLASRQAVLISNLRRRLIPILVGNDDRLDADASASQDRYRDAGCAPPVSNSRKIRGVQACFQGANFALLVDPGCILCWLGEKRGTAANGTDDWYASVNFAWHSYLSKPREFGIR